MHLESLAIPMKGTRLRFLIIKEFDSLMEIGSDYYCFPYSFQSQFQLLRMKKGLGFGLYDFYLLSFEWKTS